MAFSYCLISTWTFVDGFIYPSKNEFILSLEWVIDISSKNVPLRYTGTHCCQALYIDWSHSLSPRCYLLTRDSQHDSNSSTVSVILMHLWNSASKSGIQMRCMGQFLLSFPKYVPFAKAVASSRKNLCNSRPYDPILVCCDKDRMSTRHCSKPSLEKPNKWGFWLIQEYCTTKQYRLFMMV